jgi:HD-GYP domain-containing protein (c-di-GMP phosphodiesterase class II)
VISARAHRPAMLRDKALAEIAKEVPVKLDPFCFNALKRVT